MFKPVGEHRIPIVFASLDMRMCSEPSVHGGGDCGLTEGDEFRVRKRTTASLYLAGRSHAGRCRWAPSLHPLHSNLVPFAVVNLSAATHFYVYLLAIMVSLVYIRRADCDLTR